ncbi:hypothetical protein VE02_01924 [Pseudogymnoascus sp. 03VT05]|nr:hypothetical protein VE02_01924 [Pseudogymnoascus sp. 03VT05]
MVPAEDETEEEDEDEEEDGGWRMEVGGVGGDRRENPGKGNIFYSGIYFSRVNRTSTRPPGPPASKDSQN